MSTTAASATYTANAADVPARTLHGPVLLATDGRARTDATAITARLVAEHLGARIHALSVLQPLPVYTLGYEQPVLPPDFERDRRADLDALVRHRLEPVLGARERWHLDLRYGQPGRAIADVAREIRAGLIVVGTGGHRAIDRLLGEEVSLQVVRHASTPVLAVAPYATGPIRRAVVGMDFGAASIRAAQAALALLDPGPDGGGLLSLVHVRSPLEDTPPMLATWSTEYDTSVAAMLLRVRDLLRPYVPAGVTIESRTLTGAVVDRLKEVASGTGADLIAVGTHGPGWMERLFVGSIATTALRRAETSLLVAPTPPAADRVRLELRVAGQVTLDRVDDWAGALDALTRRNLCRRARLEVSDPELRGFAIEADRYRFRGAAYDPNARQLEIMLGDEAEPGRHVTHGITDVQSLEIVAEDDRRDRALLVDGVHGTAVLTFLD